MEQSAVDDRALMQLDHRVLDITNDFCPRLHFQRIAHRDPADDRAVAYKMCHLDVPFDQGIFAKHQGRGGSALSSLDIADNFTVTPQTAGKTDAPFDPRSGTDETIDSSKGLTRIFPSKHRILLRAHKTLLDECTTLKDACFNGLKYSAGRQLENPFLAGEMPNLEIVFAARCRFGGQQDLQRLARDLGNNPQLQATAKDLCSRPRTKGHE